ncbi:MAG: hypothetical protein EOM67_07975 [Spirochaetia bacterium]|nr:hypothetical protein [Spirochaetia bacterium]
MNENIGNTGIIITSYSPYLIQYLKLHFVYIGVLNDEEKAVFKRIASSKTKVLISTAQDLGLSAGEFLFELMSMNSKTEYIMKNYIMN